MRQVELLAAAQRDGGAEHAACVLEHEVHLLGRNLLCCDDEVALVLAVFVVDNDDELSFFEVFYSILNAAQFEIFHIVYVFLSVGVGLPFM